MKKILCFVMSLILCIVIVSASAKARDPGGTALHSYEDYLEFVTENSMSDNFVYYESLSMFGEFISIWFSCCDLGCDTCDYGYSMYDYYKTEVDKLGLNFGITVNVDGSSYRYCQKAYVLVDVTSNDLRYSPKASGHSIYVFDDVIYLYNSGALQQIIWINNGRSFSITSHDIFDFRNYPKDISTSLIGKLFDKRTAPDVIEFLKTHDFTGKPDDVAPNTADSSQIFATLALISAGGFTIFAVAKKRRKAANA